MQHVVKNKDADYEQSIEEQSSKNKDADYKQSIEEQSSKNKVGKIKQQKERNKNVTKKAMKCSKEIVAGNFYR